MLGYFCHLIEDRVWFREFVPNYAKVLSFVDNTVIFLKDESIHDGKDFSKEIYSDYAKADYYLSNKYGINVPKIKDDIKKYYTEDYAKEAIENNLYRHDLIENRENVFLTKEDADLFVKRSLEDIEKIAGKYLEDIKNKR